MKLKVAYEGEVARVIAAAAILNCVVSGMNAENDGRKHRGEAMAYNDASFDQARREFEDSIRDLIEP